MSFQKEIYTFQEIFLAGDEQFAGKIKIEVNFPDPENLLQTAYDFLKRLKVSNLVVKTQQCFTTKFEEYYLKLAPNSCTILANDTEGIRRGIYKLAEILRSKTPSQFEIEELKFTPQLKTRIGRYRFGRIYEKTACVELEESDAAFPDGFLDRYASEGINAIWIKGVSLNKLAYNKWYPNDKDKKLARYESIKKIVQQCRRYGIRVFIYFVVPKGLHPGDILYEYEDLRGPTVADKTDFCPAFSGENHYYESFNQIQKSIPNLGGFLLIVEGEGAAICTNVLACGGQMCQDRCHLTIGEIYAKEIRAIYKGINDADSKAELICWFYLPWDRKYKNFHDEIIEKVPPEVVLQFNAESGSSPVQLGKARFVGDYWQCLTEVSPSFKQFAQTCYNFNRRLSAKIMVGTSHEVGSIPYVPVPQLLYRKYKNLLSVGTTDVMQVWGTGGTPGMMNFTAGRLAFTDFNQVSEADFISSLAETLWPNVPAKQVAKAWGYLSNAYQYNYPYSNMIQYYGPVADGVNWPLYAIPQNKTLYATWTINSQISGDNICECLSNHSLDEIVILFEQLSVEWKKGLDIFEELAQNYTLTCEQEKEIIRIKALYIQFRNSYNIMKFYQLRYQFFNSKLTLLDNISLMREIVKEEISLRKNMIELIKVDPILGYNPEAEGFKYSIETIEKSLSTLNDTFVQLDALEQGNYQPSTKNISYILDGRLVETENFNWYAIRENGNIKIHVDCLGVDPILDEFFFAFDNNNKDFPIHAHFDCKGRIHIKPNDCEISIITQENSWSFNITLPIKALPGKSLTNVRMNLSRQITNYQRLWSWPGGFLDGAPLNHLGLAFYNPKYMAFLLLPDSPK